MGLSMLCRSHTALTRGSHAEATDEINLRGDG
jgi:hypothetical protein